MNDISAAIERKWKVFVDSCRLETYLPALRNFEISASNSSDKLVKRKFLQRYFLIKSRVIVGGNVAERLSKEIEVLDLPTFCLFTNCRTTH